MKSSCLTCLQVYIHQFGENPGVKADLGTKLQNQFDDELQCIPIGVKACNGAIQELNPND